MSTGIRITNRNGIEEIDGATGFQVDPHANHAGMAPFRLGPTSTSNPVGTAFTVSTPGFTWVSGSMQCTGTIPAPGSFPGAMLVFGSTNVAGAGFFLTGSARTATDAVFIKNGIGIGSVSGATVVGGGTHSGDGLTVPGGGSVSLISDGFYWIPMTSSGSLVLKA
jgi:hypothetical protein